MSRPLLDRNVAPEPTWERLTGRVRVLLICHFFFDFYSLFPFDFINAFLNLFRFVFVNIVIVIISIIEVIITKLPQKLR